MILLAVDPGKKASGFAVFVDDELVQCGWDAEPPELAQAPDLVVIELPRVYDRRRWKGDPNDLVAIAIAGGVFAGKTRPHKVKFSWPEDWKGQTPKKIQAVRTERVLSSAELAVIEAAPVTAGKKHNVLDAVGIGLWELKRNAV